MFHSHIRELVLCAIGNGWTWVDQTASIHKRRVSPGEVCAALASYMNQKALPPGQISDLDTAVIAVCDDLFPDHCELFFSQFSVRCLSCGAEGQVSVPLCDTALIVNVDDGRYSRLGSDAIMPPPPPSVGQRRYRLFTCT